MCTFHNEYRDQSMHQAVKGALYALLLLLLLLLFVSLITDSFNFLSTLYPKCLLG